MARTVSLAALRAQLKAADPHRSGVSRMGRSELEFLLQHIAEGGALVRADDDVDPVGMVKWNDLGSPFAFDALCAAVAR